MTSPGATISSEYEELEKRVLETVKSCQRRKEAPLIWAMELSKCVAETAGGLGRLPGPCPELAEVVVSQLCFSNNNPSLWKCLQLSVSSSLLYPPQVLSLLTSGVIPNRRSQPGAYRLYLELLSRYAFSFDTLAADACKEKIIKSIDVTLQLSQTYRVQACELRHALVLYFFSIVVGLIDSMMDDCGLQINVFDAASGGNPREGSNNMDIDFEEKPSYKREQHEHIKRTNSFIALGVLAELVEKQKAVVLLRLVHLNMNIYLGRREYSTKLWGINILTPKYRVILYLRVCCVFKKLVKGRICKEILCYNLFFFC